MQIPVATASTRDVSTPIGDPPWDVIVIGTGMGGAAVGHRLAAAGSRVLFLEKGLAQVEGNDPGRSPTADEAEARLRAGHWPDRVSVDVDGIREDVLLPLGSGVGGSTNLYSAALERFERTDVEALPGQPHPTGGWPVPWSQWLHYYAEAERILRVRGGSSANHGCRGLPLAVPPESEIDRGYMRLLLRNGLTPYRLQVGIAYRPGCTECGGHKCVRRCKSDAQTIFVDPALATGHATLMSEAEVVRIEADAQRVTAVVVRCGGRIERFTAHIVILAAGAYHSPALLLRSANRFWPTGLANRSGQVGRNLMFHANEWLAVWPPAAASTAGPRKTIGFRDYYIHDGQRLGSVQSTGLTASFGNIAWFLTRRLQTSRFRHLPGAAKLLRLATLLAVRLFGNATIFVMLVEDLGLSRNRIMLDPNDSTKIMVRYVVGQDLEAKAQRARQLLKGSFRGVRTMSLQSSVQLNLGHACGTCRFGIDPATSVLDADCRAHGVDNLYVVDGSFMPSSGGTNPALTIAANAIRVGDRIAERLKAERGALAFPL